MKCPECRHAMHMIAKPMSFNIKSSIVVQTVTSRKCDNCGLDIVDEDEYERVRKSIHKVKIPVGSTLILQ